LPSINGSPSFPLPITITFAFGLEASAVVASMPLILSKEGVKLLLIIALAAASPSAAILFLSASLFSLSSLNS